MSEELAVVTVTVGDQDLAVPVADVVEVIGDYPVTPVPLSPPEVIGVLNLRGRIVTVLDLHARLVGGAAPPLPLMRLERGLVVVHDGAPYAIRVDAFGDLQRFDSTTLTAPRAEISPALGALSAGLHMGTQGLTVILDVDKTLLSLTPSPARAAPLRQVARR